MPPRSVPRAKVPKPLPRRKATSRLGRRVAAACLAGWGLSVTVLSGCSSIAPAPRYTDAPGSELVAELEQRRAAGSGRLLRVVDRYMGVPYKWGGTTRAGMDCSAFTRAIFRETYGIELPRTSAQMFRLGTSVSSQNDLRPGDLVFFRDTYMGPGVSHVGVYVGDGCFAHASSSKGGTVTEMTASYFRHRYAGARRVTR